MKRENIVDLVLLENKGEIMIINTKTKELNDNKNIYKLTDLEYKFIISISNEKQTLQRDIIGYVFNYKGRRKLWYNIYVRKLENLKRKLSKYIKIKKKETLNQTTYLLKSKILFT
jgi:Ni,Fe-hydrogenase maturation factor